VTGIFRSHKVEQFEKAVAWLVAIFNKISGLMRVQHSGATHRIFFCLCQICVELGMAHLKHAMLHVRKIGRAMGGCGITLKNNETHQSDHQFIP